MRDGIGIHSSLNTGFFLFDLDGTIYLGDYLLTGAPHQPDLVCENLGELLALLRGENSNQYVVISYRCG